MTNWYLFLWWFLLSCHFLNFLKSTSQQIYLTLSAHHWKAHISSQTSFAYYYCAQKCLYYEKYCWTPISHPLSSSPWTYSRSEFRMSSWFSTSYFSIPCMLSRNLCRPAFQHHHGSPPTPCTCSSSTAPSKDWECDFVWFNTCQPKDDWHAWFSWDWRGAENMISSIATIDIFSSLKYSLWNINK